MAARRIQLMLYGTAIALLLSGCGTLPADHRKADRRADPAAPDRDGGMKPASESLLRQSREQQRSGNFPQASATLERALRIDPGEPVLWLELARIRFAEGNWRQAEQMARKSASLAAAGSGVHAAARALIADAVARQGRGSAAVDGARRW